SLGAAYNQLQRFEPAIDVLGKAVKLTPSATAYYNLGFAYRHLNKLPSAKTAYREALRLDPNSADAHHNLAGVYFELRDFTRAITHYQKALELRPAFTRAAEGLRKTTLAMSQSPEPSTHNESASLKNPAPLLAAKTTPSAIDPTRARYLGRDIARAAHDLQRHFENTIVPILNHMRRLVIEGRSGSDAFQEQRKNYRAACQHNSELRKTLRLLFVRLFAADELARSSPN
ncbi:MAG: tetratricopeptide repeat protein, partial [Planctomycetaceae bacterium]|nr:tetratricopeptide repeat protein [Planctomycetaceae bacterium]